MTLHTSPGLTAETFHDTSLGINIQQFTYGIPERPGTPYTVMELKELTQRLLEEPVDSTYQGIINAFAALFNKSTYRGYYKRGVTGEFPDGLSHTIPKYNVSRDSVLGDDTFLIGLTPYEFDSSGNFFAPAAPVIEAGQFIENGLVYGQPNITIDDGEEVTFRIFLDGDPAKSVIYRFNNVPSKQIPTSSQIAVYTFSDPDTVRDLLGTLPQGTEIYNRIMSAGDYGFSWGRFKWDKHRWDNPKPGGLYPSKYDGISKLVGNGNHYNGVARKAFDLVPQADLSSDGNITVTAGQIMWNGFKLFFPGEYARTGGTFLDPDGNEINISLADSVTALATDGFETSYSYKAETRNIMSPTSVIAAKQSMMTEDEIPIIAERINAGAFGGTDPWTFSPGITIQPDKDYSIAAYDLDSPAVYLGFCIIDSINYTTNTVYISSPAKAAVGYVEISEPSPIAVTGEGNMDSLAKGGMYPLYQHPYKVKPATVISEHEPSTIGIVALDGTVSIRSILPKHTKPVVGISSDDEYLTELNFGVENWTVQGDTGALCYTEEDDQDVITIELKHTTSSTFSASDVNYFYDAREDGIRSTGIPRDVQKYDIERAIIGISDIGTITSAGVYANDPVCAETDIILLIVKPIDSYGNRLSKETFIFDPAGTPATYHSRVDGLIFIPYTVGAFGGDGTQTATFTLRHGVEDDDISCSVELYEK